MDLLKTFLSQHNAQHAYEGLMAYAKLLVEHNRKSNLIGPLGLKEVLSELLLDALLPALATPPQGPLMDIGSGAGLPGIPLAILCPELPIHLIEPRRKRHTFQRIATRRLGLKHTHLHESRIEAFDGIAPGQAGTVAAKAYRPPAELIAQAAHWLRPGGLLYLYASQTSWDAQAQEAAAQHHMTTIGQKAHPTHPERFGLVLQFKGIDTNSSESTP